MYRSPPILGLIGVLLWVSTVHAIVIRHDRPDAEYRALGDQFPAAANLLPDGSGVLVAPDFVLTAAHVGRGIADRSPRVDVGGHHVPVERIFIHPRWTGRGAHDLALLRLARSVPEVPPVDLYRAADEVGRRVTFVGNGDTGTGLTGPTDMDGQKRGATNRIDGADDDWIYFTFNEGSDATHLEGVSGPGDSGGPALVEVDGRLFVVGISVFSFDGKPGRYGTRDGYTRVSTHADWIQSIIRGETEDPGLKPGAARPQSISTSAGPVRNTSLDVDLSEVRGGPVIAAYLKAYNSRDDERMFAFLRQHFSAGYLSTKSKEQHLAYYRRLLDQHFGQIELQAVVEASEDLVVIRVLGDKGVRGDLRFTVDADSQLEDLVAAVISGEPRGGRTKDPSP